jgi:hypothetical protein
MLGYCIALIYLPISSAIIPFAFKVFGKTSKKNIKTSKFCKNKIGINVKLGSG